MLKRLISICLCTFMLCSMIFVPEVSADTLYEVEDLVFTDDLTSMDYMYSYPSAADDWHLVPLTEFKGSGAGTAITAVGYQCGETANQSWGIPNSCVIWYKAGKTNGVDRKFTKAEFVVWINNDTFAAGRTPVLKVKDSENGEVTNLTNVVWSKTTNASESTHWNCQITGMVTLPESAAFVGLGFDTDTTTITPVVNDTYFYLDKVVLQKGAEMSTYYSDGSTLDDAWSYTRLDVEEDVIGAANYNNGGYMICPTETYKSSEVIYKVPEGRSFKSFSTEISSQFSSLDNRPKIAYSEDGITYKDFTFEWIQGSRPSSVDGNNAYWSWRFLATVTAPENTNIKFIKIHQDGTELSNVAKLCIRKVSLITAGGEISGNVTDNMSGVENYNYDISNLMPYALFCDNSINDNTKKEAVEIATQTDNFKDSDLLVVNDTAKDAYVIYKAADDKVFTSVEIDEVIRDANPVINIKILASNDGDDYDEIEVTSTRIGFISNTDANAGTVLSAAWNSHYATKVSFDRITSGYKYIKLAYPTPNVTSANNYKLASVALTTAAAPENTVVSQGFKETFENTDNLCDLSGIFASAAESRFRPTAEAVGAGKTEPVYAMYKIADGKRFGYVKAKFTQTDKYLPDEVDVIALDENKEEIEWDNSSLWTEYTYTGTNQYTEFILQGEVPSNAKYLKLQMSYLEDNWRCVINGFEVYGPYDGKVYSVNEEGAATDLDGVIADGNLMGDVTFENLDSGSKTIYAIAALKENDVLVKAAVKVHTLSTTGVVTLDTEVLENCTVGANTTFEIYLFDVTNGNLEPIMPDKITF